MPLPTVDLLFPETTAQGVGFGLEPAHNVHHSQVLLARADEVSGFDEWVYRTAAEMTPDERKTHQLVMIGLFFATRPDASYATYPAFLDHLATLPPVVLRDRVMNAYIELAMHQEDEPLPTIDDILIDVNSFLRYLTRGFEDELIFPDIERQAYTYLLDPPAMQQLIVGHLRHMWHKYLAVEWERVRPTLQKAVMAFQQIDFGTMSRVDIARHVLDRESPEDHFIHKIEEATQVTFVPSAHIGPYVSKTTADDHLWVIFGARQPEGAAEDYPELSRAEILVRLNALADDSRLSILKLLSGEGEMRSQDIMQELDLSQSAASRQLTQLSATGLLKERRCSGAKCYALNEERVEDTLKAVAGFLLS